MHNNRARNVRFPFIEKSLGVNKSLGVSEIGEREFQGSGGLNAVSVQWDKWRWHFLPE